MIVYGGSGGGGLVVFLLFFVLFFVVVPAFFLRSARRSFEVMTPYGPGGQSLPESYAPQPVRSQEAQPVVAADVQSVRDRLGHDVRSLEPGDDPVARQAMADASERYATASALLDRATSQDQLRTAWLAAAEGLHATRLVRQRLGLDPGPAPALPPSDGAQLRQPATVQVGGRPYAGAPDYRPGYSHWFPGGYHDGRYVPGGWYAEPFWPGSLVLGALSGYALGSLLTAGMYGGMLGGYGDMGYGDMGYGTWVTAAGTAAATAVTSAASAAEVAGAAATAAGTAAAATSAATAAAAGTGDGPLTGAPGGRGYGRRVAVQDPRATTAADPAASRVFPGWWVVVGVFVMLMVTAGIGFYGLSVYLRALTQDQGFSVGAVSGATAVFFLVSGLVGLPVASWTARRDVRPLVAAGALACGAALLLLGRVTEVWQVYLAYALFGAGFSAASLVPGTTLVTRWFVRRRSVALSVASTGLSAGGVFITPFIAAVLDDKSLRTVSPWLALAIVVGTVPVTAVLLKPSPQAVGLQPDGDPAPPPGSPVAPLGPLARQAQRTRFFVAVTVAHLLAMLAQVGGIAHLYNLVAERADTGLAATTVSVLAVSSLVGRLLGGAVAARVSMRFMAVVLMGVQALSLVLLSVLDGAAVLLAATVLFGLTVGNLLMLHPLLLAERFGVRDYARIYSRSQLVATFGVAAGPAVIGVLHDVLDGYGAAFTLAAVASVVAGVALSVSGPTKERSPSGAA